MAFTYDIEKDALYQKGKAQGIEEGILQIALKMKKEGFSAEDIVKATGLTKEQVERLI